MFVAFCLRFASGYEYLTSMVLLAVTVTLLPVAFHLKEGWARGTLHGIKQSLMVFGAAMAGFLAVILVHASIRGEGSIVAGIASIWTNDVLRRTYGTPTVDQLLAGGTEADSLLVSPLTVVQQYIFGWKTDLASFGAGAPFTITLGPNALWLLICIAGVVVLFRFYAKDQLWARDLFLLVSTFAIPVSWFVLAKGHSYVHTHINFVLWYLLFAGALLFVIYDFLSARRFILGLAERLRAMAIGSRSSQQIDQHAESGQSSQQGIEKLV